MSPPVDFAAAHRRHWVDAELLYDRTRLGNADQLYGFSAECGLKAVMVKLGMRLTSSGVPEEGKHRRHIQDLWPEFASFAHQKRGSVYLRELPQGTPFSNWSHHDRYSRKGFGDLSTVAQHRMAASEIRRIVALAEQDGTP